jgi:uncharacterized protein
MDQTQPHRVVVNLWGCRSMPPRPFPSGEAMFPEYRDLITRLKGHDQHFTRLFDRHNSLDQTIKNMEAHIAPGTPVEIETLKKEKLALKDQLYAHLRQAAAPTP